MGLRIKTNVTSLLTQRHLTNNTKNLEESIEKLASGHRINKSADDAAGLAISEGMRSKLKSLEAAKRNASDAVSYIQTSESGLGEISNMVIRMRELTSQSASDTIGNRERSFLDKEFQQLRQEVSRIIRTTEFNGTRVLQAESYTKPMQLFVGVSDRGKNLEGNAPSFAEGEDPDILTINLSDLSTFAGAMKNLTEDAEISLIPQSADGGARDLGPDGTEALFTSLDDALNSISSYRATLGAVQSRLGSAINNMDVTNENLNAAQSRVLDVDYATESAKYAQARILSQAGLSMQVQANALPDMALALLR
ncbi:MAG: hypothetical protein KA436_00690 [Oligoflexales bacterium]|nr:hypothetical protein [Oligoflexales bacterium]